MSMPDSSQGEKERSSLIDRVRALFGLSHASMRDDIEDALEDNSLQNDFTAQERTMLKNVLGLHELRVQDVMVPRADIIAVCIDDTLADVLSVFRTAGHSRLPVHGDSLDDPRGMVHIRDFVDYIATAAESFWKIPAGKNDERLSKRDIALRLRGLGELDLSLPLSKVGVIRPVLFVPPSMPTLDLLVKMQATRTHMALVIDEYGGTDGLASIEDIVEMIVGDIEDEHDEDDSPRIDQQADRTWLVDARASLDDLNQEIGFDFTAISGEEKVDTLGGLVTNLAGRVLSRGERFEIDSKVRFDVLEADRRRLKRIRITLASQPEPAKGE